MQNGRLKDFGNTKEIIDKYIAIGKTAEGELLEKDIRVSKQNSSLRFKRIALVGKDGITNSFGLNEDITCEIDYELMEETKVFPSIHILDKYGNCILASINSDSANLIKDHTYNAVQSKGIYKVSCTIPKFLLNDTVYSINAFLAPSNSFSDMTVAEEVISFDLHETGEMRLEHTGSWIGQIRPKLAWSTKKIK
jgi:lipopolysaccharide transport system ATP-binding protein